MRVYRSIALVVVAVITLGCTSQDRSTGGRAASQPATSSEQAKLDNDMGNVKSKDTTGAGKKDPFERIVAGMTEAEAVAILGKGQRLSRSGVPAEIKVVAWVVDGRYLEVQIKDGKVAGVVKIDSPPPGFTFEPGAEPGGSRKK